MGGVDVGTGGAKRSMNSEINMIPFIDLLMVTIAFLLITAVWVTHSRIDATAQVPSSSDKPPDIVPPTKDLHVHVEAAEFVLIWKQAGTIVAESRVPMKGPTSYDDLVDAIVEQWKIHGGHVDPSDRQRDRAVLHTANTLPFRDMVAVMDAIHEAKREIDMDGKRQKVPVFATALVSR
ncbi:MAG TPA: biopolymer transporter [Polyangiaceae bacterium]|nr:biopolymer transporter [Polyangiaceae bacterium]